MKGKSEIVIYLSLFGMLLVSCGSRQKDGSDVEEIQKLQKPNIVYILADDMGYGDISALNPNAKVKTPALDSLISSGMSFSDAHSSSSVCTPSRYSILTGRYAWRTSLKRGVTWGYSPPLIASETTTVASLLKKNGYKTGCIGKWHLGLSWGVKDGESAPWTDDKIHPSQYPGEIIDFSKPILNGPTSLGFDYFFGIPASLDMRPYCYIENENVQGLPLGAVRKEILLVEKDSLVQWHEGLAGSDFKHAEVLPNLTAKAVDFIKQNKDSPFFLYFPLTAPHSPLLPSKEFRGKSNAGDYGDFIQMVDNVVKTISDTLSDNELSENTIFIFTSDNGTFQQAYIDSNYEHDGNYPYRGQKADIYEGGHRVPFIVSWKKHISPNSRSETPILLNDLMATLADLMHVKLEKDEGQDSRSILPIIMGDAQKGVDRDFLIHHSSRGFFAIRKDSLKLIKGLGSGGFTKPYTIPAEEEKAYQLYNLDEDLDESQDKFDFYSSHNKILIQTLLDFTEEGRN